MAAPYRADHVGSLLPPPMLVEAQAAHRKTGDDDALRSVEDMAIRDLVAMQEEAGLPAVTDGGVRRPCRPDALPGQPEAFGTTGRASDPVTDAGPAAFPDNHPLPDRFRYLASVARHQPKIVIPGPGGRYFRAVANDRPPPASADRLSEALARCYNRAVHGLYAAGCRYLQLDDRLPACLCAPDPRATGLAGDPDRLMGAYADLLDKAIRDRPADMKIAMHLSRGHGPPHGPPHDPPAHAVAGGCDRVADAMFNRTSVDIHFMAYDTADTARGGPPDPLRLLPAGSKRVMLGLVSTRPGRPESRDSLQRQIDAAARLVPLAQLGLASRCGFAATGAGHAPRPDEQNRKLALLVATAETVWGSVTA